MRLLENVYRAILREARAQSQEFENGAIEWTLPSGVLHNENGPAIEQGDGSKYWYIDGDRHRDGNLPAIEMANGDKEWWVEGKRHRDGGLPAVEKANGDREYWFNGKRHNEDGPAIVSGKNSSFWINGKRIETIDEFLKQAYFFGIYIPIEGPFRGNRDLNREVFSKYDESFEVISDLLMARGFSEEKVDNMMSGTLLPDGEYYILIPQEVSDIVSRILERDNISYYHS